MQCFQFLNEKEAQAWKYWIELGDNPFPMKAQQGQIDADLARKALEQQKQWDKASHIK